MNIIFFILLGIIYFFLANAIEVAIIKQLFFLIGLTLVSIGIIRYIKERYIESQNYAEMKEASEEEMKAIPHTQCLISQDALKGLLLNEHTNMLIFAHREELEEELKIIEIPFSKIYEVAMMEDEMFVLRTKNYLMSGSLLGEEENVAEEEEEVEEDDTVSQLSLKFVVDHLSEPILEYMFMDQGEHPIARDEEEYEEAMELCEKWFQKISVIIKRHELERVPIRHWQ
ncbi:hypothetical protein J2D69_20470 [Lysinibacillus sphaericus]|uniref:Uncharacterized protein n=3 Tax=Lysinibacillus TaxID=400634 RepID=B1HTZ2_LYSSC|nr:MULTISPECIES: hypothetical protein [Lysinibacillus]MBE5085877.1 hypothetical protein [Bacillus thuringiensis]ACA37883.1 hypothetical protein Bsph_0254 [Lysinibacillus sphaericus C3-41]AMO32074.1 hypothetical protein AR327_06090 [Lysinibacillus sphaericus]AMR88806.1 hypothetical protein A1T07_00575 [Lysinibacillus sphaericus]ANA46877.1 hypothetical protein A2J09_15785 [Lysinibacillus sphaericus]